MPDAAVSRDLLRRMMLVRMFERALMVAFDRGELPGVVHLGIGQEATVVGACAALKTGDLVTASHRGHGHPIARGAQLGPLMAEIYGRADGVCRGKGGSLHLADFSVGAMGASGILGGQIGLATGAAFASSVLGDGRVAITFFGDGASGEGVLYEAMNLAALWKLPVVFFCENNLYAGTVRTQDVVAGGSVAARAQGFDMPGVTVDGQDVIAVHDAVAAAVARCRSGGGPSLLEARTFRFSEHAYGLKIKDFRTADEFVQWTQHRDPIELFAARCVADGLLEQDDITQGWAEAERLVDAAVEFARNSPEPQPSSAYDDVFAAPQREVDQ